jgi:hypothetical protein
VIHDAALRHACMQSHRAELSTRCIDAVRASRMGGPGNGLPMVPHFVHTLEPLHCEVAGPLIRVDDHLVPTLMTVDGERPHVVLAHVTQGHWLD